MREKVVGVATRAGLDLERSPLLVTWELPDNLQPAAALALVDEVADLGAPALELIGDKLWHNPVLLQVVRAGRERGLQMWAAGGPLADLDRAALESARTAGLSRVTIPLDYCHPFGSPGVAAAVQRIRWATAAELLVQAETTAWAGNAKALPAMLELAARSGASIWSLALPVPRAPRDRLELLAPDEYEDVLRWLARTSLGAPLLIKATNAPMYRRILLQQLPPGAMLRKRKALLPVNDGRGLMHITAAGEVRPSCWLPLGAGRAGVQPLAMLYRGARLFLRLRRPVLLQGKCGSCPWKQICGGSRARAYAITGNCMAADPLCGFHHPRP